MSYNRCKKRCASALTFNLIQCGGEEARTVQKSRHGAGCLYRHRMHSKSAGIDVSLRPYAPRTFSAVGLSATFKQAASRV
jgi:hypothetical protein